MAKLVGRVGVVFVSVMAGACCATRSGQLSGRWIAVAGASGQAAGIAAPPSSAQPMAVKLSPTGCFDNATLRSTFGPGCKETEAEAPGSAQLTDDVTLGNQPTPGEVHWYCDRRTVVRVVLQRCGTTNEFRVQQIAVSIAGEH